MLDRFHESCVYIGLIISGSIYWAHYSGLIIMGSLYRAYYSGLIILGILKMFVVYVTLNTYYLDTRVFLQKNQIRQSSRL